MNEPYDEAQHRRDVETFIREAEATVEITWERREWVAWWFASTMLLSGRMVRWWLWGRKARS
jgi:hypothetical protein